MILVCYSRPRLLRPKNCYKASDLSKECSVVFPCIGRKAKTKISSNPLRGKILTIILLRRISNWIESTTLAAKRSSLPLKAIPPASSYLGVKSVIMAREVRYYVGSLLSRIRTPFFYWEEPERLRLRSGKLGEVWKTNLSSFKSC